MVDVYGRTIVLGGQHAFEWSITIHTRERIIKSSTNIKGGNDGFIHILIGRLAIKPALSLYHI